MVYNIFVKSFEGKAVVQMFDAREKTPWLKAFFIKGAAVPFPSSGVRKRNAQIPTFPALRGKELNSRWNRVSYCTLERHMPFKGVFVFRRDF